ncbi:MAG: hypothetical protein LKE47_03750 [Prevotella sp.]|nr:hypothetical protein [Prevotella sp.]MCH3969540.1 hypothetical protein [Prevotella sp.]
MKAFNRFLKKHIQIICLLTLVLTSCNYLDVVPPETADLKDTMKDREAALEFLYSCYAGIPSLFTDALYHIIILQMNLLFLLYGLKMHRKSLGMKFLLQTQLVLGIPAIII